MAARTGNRRIFLYINAQPVKQKLYPVAPSVEGEIMRQVNEMLSNGICRPSNSTWSSRVLLVTKRDGSRRFCVDFMELNRVTRADSYPMPHPRDILDRMYGDSYYSFLDGASAYWAIEIDEEDKYKTSFATPKGLFEFNRMSFGLINSGSTYQRLMDETLRDVNRADPYVDDICVHSNT